MLQQYVEAFNFVTMEILHKYTCTLLLWQQGTELCKEGISQQEAVDIY